jgi:FkbM family methyltransferase
MGTFSDCATIGKMMRTAVLNVLRGAFFQNPVMEETLRRWTKGRPTSHWLCRLTPNHYQYASLSLRKIKLGSGTVELDLSEFMEWHFYYDFLDESISNLIALAEPGDHVLDVGSNIGATVLALCERVGETGSVVGFEPDPDRFKKCTLLLEANGLGTNVVYPFALGASSETGKIRIRNPSNKGMNQVCSATAETSRGTLISIRKLDDFVENENISRIDLIKIDVEGYEAKVMAGALRTLSKFRPRLFIEIDASNLRDHNAHPEDIFGPLRQLGYSLYRNSILQPIDEKNQSTYLKDHFDLVALPNA